MSSLDKHSDIVIEKSAWQSAERSAFKGIDNARVEYIELLHSADHQTIVVSPGRCEGYEKYQELALELYNVGYNIFVIDHRGQGLSSRMLEDPHKGYVASFDHYAQDLVTFVTDIVSTKVTAKPFLLAHSMGSAIAIRALQLAPDLFSSGVLCSPMIQIESGGIPISLAKLIIRFRCLCDRLFSKESNYFLNQQQYKAKSFEENELTHSKERYNAFVELYQSMSSLQLGGVTNHWLLEAINAQHNIFTDMNRLKVPLLVLQAGMDTIVNNPAQNDFCKEATKFCPISGPIVFAKAKHELLFETDNIRSEVISHILQFFKTTKEGSLGANDN